MKIIITGAAGQIGSSLAWRLKDKHDLVLVDNLRNGHFNKIEDLEFPFYNVSVASPDFFDDFSGDYDAIIHLAGVTTLPDCECNPVDTLSSNVLGTSNVLNFSRRKGIPHVIFASTAAVYEQNKEDVLTEDLDINPRLYYSLSKKMCEELIASYRKNYGCNITTLRFFNIFGPDGDKERLNPPLINYVHRELMKGLPPVLCGDGEQVRDFICIDDVLAMIELCLDKKPNDTFNVCTGVTTSVNQITKWVSEELGLEHLGIKYRKSNQLWDTYPDLFEGQYPFDKNIVVEETEKYTKGSYEKAKKILGWEPSTDIESEVKRIARLIK